MSDRYGSQPRIGPETRAIIGAIDGLKKPTHEYTNYRVIQIDLAVARANELYELEGWFDFLGVGKLTGACSIRINEPTKDLIDLAYVKTMKVPIRRLYITNAAQAGAELTLGIGGDASFEAEPIRAGRKIFGYGKLDEDGALNVFETSQAKIVLPTFMVDTFMNPADLKEGIMMKVKVRMNPTNAATYTLRLWESAVNGAVTPYMQEMACIYEMDFPGLDDIAYTIMMERPFGLYIPGQLWYSIEWSAAPGNTPGCILIQGELIR
jgi:hypothetical protein